MNHRTLPLEALGDLKQGPTLSRYLDPNGPERRILQIGNLRDLTVQTRTDDRMERLHQARTDEHHVKAGQVLISLRGSVLKAAVVEQDIPDAMVSNSITTLDPKRELVHPHFLAALLSSGGMQQQVAPLFTGVAIQGIPLAKFRKLLVTLPPLPEQLSLARAFLALAAYRHAVDDVIKLRTDELELHLQPFVAQERA